LRLRRRQDVGWQRRSVTVQPRSLYILRGPARRQWEHSVPPVDSLRYAVTFRNLVAA
jgi:alkylated DNA repair dioxygenase AlkB